MVAAGSPSMTTVSDNELNTYRSLSSLAVISFVLGLLSLLSFAPSWVFVLVFPPAALIFGLMALRQVAAAPEVWTGLKLAKTGIALALVCAVASVAGKIAESNRLERDGRVVADRFVSKLKAGDTEGAFWLKFPRENRAALLDKSPDEMPTEFTQQYAMFYSEFANLSQELARGEATLEFETVEMTMSEHGTEYAALLYGHHSPKEDSHMLVVASSVYSPGARTRSWYIREHRLGYKPASFEGATQGGHGHGHSH